MSIESNTSSRGGCTREGVWKGEQQGVVEKRLVGARAKWVLSGVEQCETCADGGPMHQPAKDSAALLRVRAVQVCIHNHVKSRMRGRIGGLVQVGPSQVSRPQEPVVSHLMHPHAC